MAKTGYGADDGDADAHSDPETTPRVWWDALEAVYKTDPERVAAVLPPPLREPPEPQVRLTIAVGETDDGTAVGHLWFGVAAEHEGELGEYALLVGVSTDHEVVEGRELLGEPRKLVSTTSFMNAERIQHKAERRGQTLARIVGSVTGPADVHDDRRTEFTIVPAPAGPAAAFGDAVVMRLERTVVERRAVTVTGAVRLGASPYDPLNSIKVRRTGSIRLSQRTTRLDGRPVATVPMSLVAPYLHQRYDRTFDSYPGLGLATPCADPSIHRSGVHP